MFIKRHLMKVVRWGLRLHGVGHLIEVFSAIAEGASAAILLTSSTIAFFASRVRLTPRRPLLHSYPQKRMCLR